MNKGLSKETKAELLLFVLAMIWGGSFVAAKFSMTSFDPYWVMVLRYGLGTLLLWLCFPKEHRKLNKPTLAGGLEVGILLGAGTAFQMVGLQYTTPANQTFIIVSYVITVPLLNFAISKVKPGRHILVAAVFTVIGVGFLTLGPGTGFNIGDVMTFIMALLFAVQIIRIDYWMPKVTSSIMFTAVQFFAATMISLVLFFINGRVMYTGEVTTAAILGMVYIVVLNTAVGYVIQNYAQRDASPDKSALIISSESLFGTFAAYFFAGEDFPPKKIIGCIFILIGQFFAQVLPALKKMGRERGVPDKNWENGV